MICALGVESLFYLLSLFCTSDLVGRQTIQGESQRGISIYYLVVVPSDQLPKGKQTSYGKSCPRSMEVSSQVSSLQEVPENKSWQVTYGIKKIWQKVTDNLEAWGLPGRQIPGSSHGYQSDKHTHLKMKVIVWLTYDIDHSCKTGSKVYEGLL